MHFTPPTARHPWRPTRDDTLGDRIRAIAALIPAWHADAACASVGPHAGDVFFPERDADLHDDLVAAKRVCAVCPVVAECLQDALDADVKFGVWGGLSTGERIRVKKGQAATAA